MVGGAAGRLRYFSYAVRRPKKDLLAQFKNMTPAQIAAALAAAQQVHVN